MIPNCVGLKKVCGDLLTSLLCIFSRDRDFVLFAMFFYGNVFGKFF